MPAPSRTAIDYAGGYEELHSGLRDGFKKLLLAECGATKTALDAGCGTGRVGFFLAGHVKRVIGVDKDAKAVEAAKARARKLGTANVEFVVGDVERTPHVRWHPEGFELIAANLCLSEDVVLQAGRALTHGSALVFSAFGAEQWTEVGGSRFAMEEAAVRRAAERAGLRIESLTHDALQIRFRSIQEAREALGDTAEAWIKDGRWDRLADNFAKGKRTLTESRIVGVARR